MAGWHLPAVPHVAVPQVQPALSSQPREQPLAEGKAQEPLHIPAAASLPRLSPKDIISIRTLSPKDSPSIQGPWERISCTPQG